MRRVIALGLCLAACGELDPNAGATHVARPELDLGPAHRFHFDRPAYTLPEPVRRNIRVATFNLQVFGPSKASDARLVDEVASIIERYDVVAVQELKDVSEEAPYVLLDALEKRGAPHAMILSERGGREPDDASSREQYAYFYDATKLAVIGTPALFDDSAHDRFQREPYIARFEALGGALDFVMVNIHTRPDSAVEEIDALSDVASWAWNAYGTPSVVVLGDFNASCAYAEPSELDALDLRDPEYLWVVPDDADTNAAASVCAYDRVVLWGRAAEAFEGSWGVDVGFEQSGLSDHWPVWVDLTDTVPASP